MKKELICINCPMGCNITVEMNGNEIVSVEGNSCPLGERYARQEVIAPKRVLTSSVAVINGKNKVVSVKTDQAIEKALLAQAMEEINRVEVQAPVKIGQIIIENILSTGANVIATKNMDAE